MKILEISGYSTDQAKGMYDPLRVDLRNLFNPSEAYGDFIIPGILIIILQQTLLIGLSESIAREREKNLLGELLAAANGSNSAALLGKASFYLFFLFGIFRFLLYRNICILENKFYREFFITYAFYRIIFYRL